MSNRIILTGKAIVGSTTIVRSSPVIDIYDSVFGLKRAF